MNIFHGYTTDSFRKHEPYCALIHWNRYANTGCDILHDADGELDDLVRTRVACETPQMQPDT